MPKKQNAIEINAAENKYNFKRTTKYGGQLVNKEEMEQIKKEPISNFLSFHKEKEGEYRMTGCFPESMEIDGKKIQVRKAINTLAKYISKQFFDEKGNLKDPDAELDELVYCPNPKKPYEQLEILNIPDPDREMIQEFFQTLDRAAEPNAIGDNGALWMRNIIGAFAGVKTNLHNYSELLTRFQNKTSEEHRPEMKLLLEHSINDYCNEVTYLKKTADMNPEKETEIPFYLECTTFAELAGKISKLMGTGEKVHAHEVSMRDMKAEAGECMAFDVHKCLIGNVKLNGKDKVISVEMTAPATNQVLFAPSKGRTGTGIFEDSNALSQYHKMNNIVIGDETKLASLKRTLSSDKTPFVQVDHLRQSKIVSTHRSAPGYGKKGIEFANKKNSVAMKTRLSEAVQAKGRFYDSEQYKSFCYCLEMAEAFCHLINKCKEEGKTSIDLKDIRKVSKFSELYTLENGYFVPGTKTISIQEAGVFLEDGLNKATHYAKEYKDYKMQQRKRDAKGLTSDDMKKLKIINKYLPEEDRVPLKGNNVQLENIIQANNDKVLGN